MGFILRMGGKSTHLGRGVHSPAYAAATKQAPFAPHLQATTLSRQPNTISTGPAFSFQPTKHHRLAPFSLYWVAQATEISQATVSPATKMPLCDLRGLKYREL